MAGLYVQVPFRQTLHSSDGAHAVAPDSADESIFVEALSLETDRYAQHPLTEAPISTIYIGSDRPSLFSLRLLDTITSALRTVVDASAITETTVELSPDDISSSYLNDLRQLGLTRVSLDALSFAPGDLRAVGAPHSIDDLFQTLRHVHRAGVDAVSVDLSFGGGEHPLSHWKASLHRAVELRVPHIALRERDPSKVLEADQKERARRLGFAMRFLRAKGYEQYELTHFARPGHRSRHQEKYYAHGNYLGLGPGAESFWWPDRTDPPTARRWSNVSDLATYVERLRNDASPVEQLESPDRSALAREYILLRLRTKAGLDLDVLGDRYGFPLRTRRASTLDRLAEEELIHDDPDRVRLTDRGRLLTDAITQRLIREE